MAPDGTPGPGRSEWSADVALDEAGVRSLVAGQFPQLSLDGLAPLAEGWDNALWVTGDGIAFRFPRRAIAVPGVEREINVLPVLAPRLPLPVPIPRYIGRPAGDYPWPFFGARLLEGHEIAAAGIERRSAFGAGLGAFLRVLHAPDLVAELGRSLPRDPNARATMAVRVPRTRAQLERLATLGLWRLPTAATVVLDEAASLPDSTEEALVHGDLHVRHVLVHDDGTPAGVIDWGDVCVADPSVDLALYWSQLEPAHRAAFRAAYGADALPAHRLVRARVLALFLDAALAAYAHDTGDAALLKTTLEGLDRTLSG